MWGDTPVRITGVHGLASFDLRYRQKCLLRFMFCVNHLSVCSFLRLVVYMNTGYLSQSIQPGELLQAFLNVFCQYLCTDINELPILVRAEKLEN